MTPHPLEAQLRHLAPYLVPELPLWLLPPDAPAWSHDDPAALGWPYWAFAWPGGQALARAVLDAPELVAGRRVLDFGSGCGVEGLAALRAGAASVCCADVDPYARRAARRNAEALGLRVETTEADLLGHAGAWDVVLAGDVCFEPRLAAAVMAWLRREAARGVRVLVGDPGRVEVDRSGYTRLGTWRAPFDGDPRGAALWDTQVLHAGG